MATSLCGAVNFGNTGEIGCDNFRGVPTMLLVGSATFSSSDYVDSATMDAAMIAKTKLGTGSSQKLFPFPTIQGNADQTEAAKYGTLGYGLREKLVDARPAYEFDVRAGSNLEKKLKTFDGKSVPVIIRDDKNQFWGRLNSSNQFEGAVYQIGVTPQPFGDGQNPKVTKITISIVNPRDFVENAKVYVSTTTSLAFAGLKDVTMRVLSNVTNVYKIKLEIITDLLGTNLDIYDDYGALIQPLTFTAFTGTTYTTSLAITSVAVDATLKALTVTFDSTAYTALASGAKIKLVAPLPAILDAANVVGIEIATLIITKP
jgi:hypothetical protein